MPDHGSSSVNVPAQVDDREDQPVTTSTRLNLVRVLIGALVIAGGFLLTYGFSAQDLMEASGPLFLISMGALVVVVVAERFRRR